jgi:FkbM family methyltransferase
MISEVNSPNIAGLDYSQTYRQYLLDNKISLRSELESKVHHILEGTNWEDPQSGLDWNNCGVIALIEATNSQDLSDREMYLEIAISAFEQGMKEHPLCHAHMAMIATLLGDDNKARQMGFTYLTGLVQVEHGPNPATLRPGLIYLPPNHQPPQNSQVQLFTELLQSEGYQQCSLFLGEVILQSQMIFYNSSGLRTLQLAAQLFPNLASINLRLGISSLNNGQREGLLYLHQAAQAAPTDFSIALALAIICQDSNQTELSNYWQAKAQTNAHSRQPSLPTDILINPDNIDSFVPYDGLWMAVEPSFRSIVTSVLVAEGDWFERELEFWRSQIKPGMVVLDVGANVGVYTFSAATRVGITGQVIAVEPFSGCVTNLEATCQINHLNQVKVYRGAASDHEGQIYLSLSAASELNEVVTDPTATQNGNFEEAPCFTLDSICTKENLSQVDFLKIDAEGHELQVLIGSQQLLERFSPVILYENIAGSQGSNIEVAEYLQKIGYQLFRYQPYLQKLIPAEIAADFQGCLNLIAMRSA